MSLSGPEADRKQKVYVSELPAKTDQEEEDSAPRREMELASGLRRICSLARTRNAIMSLGWWRDGARAPSCLYIIGEILEISAAEIERKIKNAGF